jgi:hypothetical protein
MLLPRDDEIPRDDRAVIVLQRVILAILLLVLLGMGVGVRLARGLPIDALLLLHHHGATPHAQDRQA